MFNMLNINLDGVNNGIQALLRREQKVFTNENGVSLFSNFKTLNGALYRAGLDYHLYKFQFSIDEGKYVIDLDDCYYDSNWNAYIPVRRDIFGSDTYFLRETIDEEVIKIGYIVTDQSDVHTSNEGNKFEYAKLKNLRKLAASCISGLATYPYYGFTVSKDKFGTVINLSHTSAKVHIYTNAKVIDYNVAVKARNERVLPFMKEMSKYGTLYIFATCDVDEKNNDAVLNMIDNCYEAVINYMDQCAESFGMKEVYYAPHVFKGYIKFNRKETIPNDDSNGSNNTTAEV